MMLALLYSSFLKFSAVKIKKEPKAVSPMICFRPFQLLYRHPESYMLFQKANCSHFFYSSAISLPFHFTTTAASLPGNSSGIFCVTAPVAAHSAPRCKVVIKPRHSIE